MTQVMKLQLYENKIEFIGSDSFHDLINLEYLDLDRNKIKKLPADLLIMSKKLRVFMAAHNSIQEIPINFFNNTELVRKLDFGSNKIENFDFIADVWHEFKNLTYINLRANGRCHKFFTLESKLSEIFKNNTGMEMDFANDIFGNILLCARRREQSTTLSVTDSSTKFNIEDFKESDDKNYDG
jgi:hypothetical protein